MSRHEDRRSSRDHGERHRSSGGSRYGNDRRDDRRNFGGSRSGGGVNRAGADRRDRERRNFGDSRKFNRSDQMDRGRNNRMNHQGHRGTHDRGGNDSGGFRRNNDRRGGGSGDVRHRDDRDRRRFFDRNQGGGYGNNNNRRPLSQQSSQPRRRTDSERMPPPNRRVLQGRPRMSGGGNDRQRRAPIRSDGKSAQLRRRLTEKHVVRRQNTGRDLLAKKIRMAKLRSTMTKRRTALPARRLKSAVKKPEKKENWDDSDDEEKEKDDKEEKSSTTKKGGSSSADEKSADGEDGESKVIKVKEEKKSPARKEKAETKKSSSAPIKVNLNLECIQCKSKCLTVKEYNLHLSGRAHDRAMQRLALRQRAQLSRLRLVQRSTQKEIDDKLTDARSNYCSVCMLRHRQTREEHAETEDHRVIQKFLRPYCGACKIRFRRPMMFEQHRCSIEHLRRKAINEKTGKPTEGDECEVDLGNFTTVDEVGEDDESGDEAATAHTKENEEKQHRKIHSDSEDIEIENEEINVGNEHIKQVSVMYCELCYSYISHRGDVEVNLKRHCAGGQHLKFYIRYKDDIMLKEEAEALHKKRELEKKKKEKELAEKKAKAEAEKAEKAEKAAAEGAEEAQANENDEDMEEEKKELNGSKADESEMWAELNQDIGELIHDDEEESKDDADDNRYDRLNSEKNGVKENGTSEEKGEEKENKKEVITAEA